MMKRQQGFSLVEVLVAVVVLGVIVAAFSGVFSSSIDPFSPRGSLPGPDGGSGTAGTRLGNG